MYKLTIIKIIISIFQDTSQIFFIVNYLVKIALMYYNWWYNYLYVPQWKKLGKLIVELSSQKEIKCNFQHTEPFFAYLSHFLLKHFVSNHFMYTPSLASLVYEIELFGLQSEVILNLDVSSSYFIFRGLCWC